MTWVFCDIVKYSTANKDQFSQCKLRKVASTFELSVITSFVSAEESMRTWICRRPHCFHSRELMSKCCLSLNKSLNESIMKECGLDLLLGWVSWEGLCWETRSYEFNPTWDKMSAAELQAPRLDSLFLFVQYLLITLQSVFACTIIHSALFPRYTEKPACVGSISWRSLAKRCENQATEVNNKLQARSSTSWFKGWRWILVLDADENKNPN